MSARALSHRWLESRTATHGFGTRGSGEPDGLWRPKQVHGIAVARVGAGRVEPQEADAIVTDRPGELVGVVTADCVPVLLATRNGVVGAVHAGWRGLAAGVVPVAVDAIATLAGVDAIDEAVAVIGPHVGACCYEVDAPVVDALSVRLSSTLAGAAHPARPGHWQLDLAVLVRADLERAGLRARNVDLLTGACTACDPERFHSYRRDGPRSGRLFHFVSAPSGLDTAE